MAALLYVLTVAAGAQPLPVRRASSQPNLSDGKILEAVLTRYEDLDSYRSAKAQFFAANPKAADYKPMLVRPHR